jgi:hypothetical protein
MRSQLSGLFAFLAVCVAVPALVPPVSADMISFNASLPSQTTDLMNYPAASCEVSKTQKEPSKSVS